MGSSEASELQSIRFSRGRLMAGAAAVGAGTLLPRKLEAIQQSKVGDVKLEQPISILSGRLRGRTLKAVDLVANQIDRIRSMDTAIGAFETTAFNSAVRSAERVDKLILDGRADFDRQPLLGIPFTAKDILETKNLRTTAGAPAYTDYIPDVDALAVERIKNAGGILLGKTRTPLLAMALEAQNAFGESNNPHDLNRNTGGSSGGAAAAVASGMSIIDLSHDGGISIRLPAAYCGALALVPSYGRVPIAGLLPKGTENVGGSVSFNSLGPIGRYVDDVEQLYHIIKGPDYRDPFTFALPDRKSKDVNTRSLRVGWWTGDTSMKASDAVAEGLEIASQALGKTGITIKKIEPPHDLMEANDIYLSLVGAKWVAATRASAESLGAQKDTFLLNGASAVETIVKERYPEHKAVKFREKLPEIRVELQRALEDYDAVLCPVSRTNATPHNYSWTHLEDTIYSIMWGFAFTLPAGTIPVHRSETGLPVGVQIIGKRHREDTVLALMKILEQELGGWDQFKPTPIPK